MGCDITNHGCSINALKYKLKMNDTNLLFATENSSKEPVRWSVSHSGVEPEPSSIKQISCNVHTSFL